MMNSQDKGEKGGSQQLQNQMAGPQELKGEKGENQKGGKTVNMKGENMKGKVPNLKTLKNLFIRQFLKDHISSLI